MGLLNPVEFGQHCVKERKKRLRPRLVCQLRNVVKICVVFSQGRGRSMIPAPNLTQLLGTTHSSIPQSELVILLHGRGSAQCASLPMPCQPCRLIFAVEHGMLCQLQYCRSRILVACNLTSGRYIRSLWRKDGEEECGARFLKSPWLLRAIRGP
jgi:hypothetical protein